MVRDSLLGPGRLNWGFRTKDGKKERERGLSAFPLFIGLSNNQFSWWQTQSQRTIFSQWQTRHHCAISGLQGLWDAQQWQSKKRSVLDKIPGQLKASLWISLTLGSTKGSKAILMVKIAGNTPPSPGSGRFFLACCNLRIVQGQSELFFHTGQWVIGHISLELIFRHVKGSMR